MKVQIEIPHLFLSFLSGWTCQSQQCNCYTQSIVCNNRLWKIVVMEGTAHWIRNFDIFWHNYWYASITSNHVRCNAIISARWTFYHILGSNVSCIKLVYQSGHRGRRIPCTRFFASHYTVGIWIKTALYIDLPRWLQCIYIDRQLL